MSIPVEHAPAPPAPSEPEVTQRRGITWRSLLLGTVGVILICLLVPYNDFVLSDTSLASGFLPLAAVLIVFVLVIFINGPLHRWAPRHALGPRELAVVLLMVLAAASLPAWGLMQFFIPTPVAPFFLGTGNPAFWDAFLELDLPQWLFPVPNIAEGRNEPVITYFYSRVPEGERAPYGAWIGPLLVWGIFVGAMLLTLVAIARLVLEQWIVNERLPFPLVQVQVALIEAPEPGRALNGLFRSTALWVGLGGVFAIHSISALNSYFPRYVPEIPLGYDLTNILTEEPFVYLRGRVKTATLFFSLIGLTYFIRARAAFSLWAIYLMVNVMEVQQGMTQSDFVSPATWADAHMGAAVAFVLGVLWIGRHHWARVVRNGLWLGTDSSYRWTFWIIIIGVLTMVGWLWVVGVQLWMAVMIVLFIVMAHLVVTRIVAETGLPHYRTPMALSQLYTNLPGGWFAGRDIYFAQTFTVLGPLTTRDSLMVNSQTGMGVCHSAGMKEPEQGRLIGVLAYALLIGFVLAAGAVLYCHYAYSMPMTRDEVPQRNNFGAVALPERDIANPFLAYREGNFPAKPHNPWLHMGVGFGIVAALQAASLRWVSWPLLPVGFVTSHGAFIQTVWFSIMIGWLVKVLIVRFGGATLFQRARPFFVGIIFGEALAAGTWLLINAVLVWQGGDSRAIQFLA
jgi:hypothetical protein